MGLMDLLRKAQQQGRDAARHGKETVEDAERRIRRKMRLFPASYRTYSSRPADTVTAETPRPIISVRGRDVDAFEIERAGRERSIA